MVASVALKGVSQSICNWSNSICFVVDARKGACYSEIEVLHKSSHLWSRFPVLIDLSDLDD